MPFNAKFGRMAGAGALPLMNPAARSRGFVIGRPAGLGLDALARAVIGRIALWRQRAMDRAELARMSSRELRDIRINPGDAWNEASKPFWRG